MVLMTSTYCTSLQYARDTLARTGAAYLMEAVEGAAKIARGGAEDAVNKMLGGVAAGGLLGVMCECRSVGAEVRMNLRAM